MDFSEVVDQLIILNEHAEDMSRGQLDLIQISNDLLERIDDMTDAIGDGITNDTRIAREQARRDRLNALRGGEQQGGDPRTERRERQQMDGLLTSLVTGIAATGAVIYGAIAGIALAGTRFTDALDGARESTIELVSGIRGMFSTFALMTSQFRAFTLLGGILATMPVSIPIILTDWVSRLFRQGGVVTDAVRGLMNGIASIFSGLANRITRIPGIRRLGSILNGVWRVLSAVTRAIMSAVGFVIPFGGVLARFAGVLIRTVGRFSGVLTAVMIIVDGIRGAIDGWQETGTIMGAIRGTFMGVVEGFANMFRDIGTFLGWVTESIANLIPWFDSGQARQAGDAVRGLFDTIGEWTMKIGTFFTDITMAVAGFFVNPVDTISRIAAFATDMATRAEEYVSGLISGIVDTVTGFMSSMVRAIASRMPNWMPGRSSLLSMADGIDSLRGVTITPPTVVAPSDPTARPADVIDMRPTERASIVAINAPTVNQTNVQTNNRQNTVVSAPPAVRDVRYATIR